MAIDALTDAGFEVIEAARADEALLHLQQRASSIHLVFTDVHMPGAMNGLGLAKHVATHWPWIQILVTSGEVTPGPDEIPRNGRFLKKPYSLNDVLHHAVQLLEQT